MKLLRVQVISAATCGGLLDGFEVQFRSPSTDSLAFDPLCLIGPNGTGKSQLMQVLAEMLQSAVHACNPLEERRETNPGLHFELEYLIRPLPTSDSVHMRVSRRNEGRSRSKVLVERKEQLEWVTCDLAAPETRQLLPRKVVGYTSGDNETLSLPFLESRSGYAEDVSRIALALVPDESSVIDTRLMLIDYGTHLEVLVANLLLGTNDQREALLKDALVNDLHSFRCIVQLNHSAAPKVSSKKAAVSGRRGVQLTAELETYVEQLKRCATCHTYDEKTETYVLDYWINDATRKAFGSFWTNAFDLYSSFHKLAMLNDLAIAKSARETFRREARTRRFASRLPEPQDEDKVFRFERVRFVSQKSTEEVDYVSLSDGEHQLAQILGTFCMLSFPNVLFLLDEPESHLNPQWRVKFLSRIRDLPTADGLRSAASGSAQQEVLLTTHAPFVPSDMSRDKVFIFKKTDGTVTANHPDTETYGTNFDDILKECFGVRPPISDLPKEDIARLMQSNEAGEIEEGIQKLGNSVDRVFLADRLRQLRKKDEK
jgi:restriction system-associated AAA family ATPase